MATSCPPSGRRTARPLSFAVEDLRGAMADILGAFRPGTNNFLTSLLRGKRVEKILFAATKADHLHHSQHPRLSGIMQALIRDAESVNPKKSGCPRG